MTTEPDLLGATAGICKLCLELKPLCKSHMLPKRLYARLREASDDENHFRVRHEDGDLKLTQRQIWAHLLCVSCEDRFNKQGEGWVIANSASKAGFPLADALRSRTALNKSGALDQIYLAQGEGVDIETLIYFPTSVVWRRSVGNWTLANRIAGEPKDFFALGARAEEFRRYLLCQQPFPKDVSIKVEVERQEPPEPVVAVYRVPCDATLLPLRYKVLVPGIQFTLTMNVLPNGVEMMMSIVNNPVTPLIFLTSWGGSVVDEIGPLTIPEP